LIAGWSINPPFKKSILYKGRYCLSLRDTGLENQKQNQSDDGKNEHEPSNRKGDDQVVSIVRDRSSNSAGIDFVGSTSLCLG